MDTFASPNESMPAELLDALFLIDEMSDEQGMDSLVNAAANANLVLESGDDHSAADIAVQVWLSNREILEAQHAIKQLKRPKSFEYFQATKGQLVSCDEIFRLSPNGKLLVATSSKSAIGEFFGVKPSGNVFKRNGEGDWTVAFGGASRPVKHVNGLSYIAILLGNPDIDFRVQDIDEQVTGINSAYTKSSSDPLSTNEALRKIDERLEDAVDELRNAQRNHDIGTIEARQLEIEDLQQEKRRCSGLGGKIRTSSELEKMRKRVARNIDTAIKSIRRQDTQLGDHLDCFIDRGLVLKYRPNAETLWIT